MKKVLLFLLFMAFTLTGWCQVTGKVYVNDLSMNVPAGKPDHFGFEASKTSLDDAAIEYLQYFIDQYNNDFPKKVPVYIRVVPSSNGSKDEGEKTALKRVEAMRKVLKNTNIHILKTNYKDQVLTCDLKLR